MWPCGGAWACAARGGGRQPCERDTPVRRKATPAWHRHHQRRSTSRSAGVPPRCQVGGKVLVGRTDADNNALSFRVGRPNETHGTAGAWPCVAVGLVSCYP